MKQHNKNTSTSLESKRATTSNCPTNNSSSALKIQADLCDRHLCHGCLHDGLRLRLTEIAKEDLWDLDLASVCVVTEIAQTAAKQEPHANAELCSALRWALLATPASIDLLIRPFSMVHRLFPGAPGIVAVCGLESPAVFGFHSVFFQFRLMLPEAATIVFLTLPEVATLVQRTMTTTRLRMPLIQLKN